MIRLAVEKDFYRPVTDLASLRIAALWEAYGDVPFIRYYTDGEGGLLAVMDGVGFFSVAGDLTEEWIAFLSMVPDLQRLCCSGEVGKTVSVLTRWPCRTSVVLEYKGERPSVGEDICRTPSLPAVYALLQQCFDTLSPFEAWYPDVSHRVRHDCCMLACKLAEDRVVSTAMTVAQADGHALLGQVATDPAFRCRGYAASCLLDLVGRWQGKHLYIIPANDNARILYEKLGFCPQGTWAELIRE